MEKLICTKLLELMETRPYESIRVTELAKYAGIGRSTFYLHFDSIYAVLQKIEDDFIAGLPEEDSYSTELLRNDRRSKIEYFRYLQEHKRTYRVLNGPNGDPSFRVRLNNRSRRILLNNAAAAPDTPRKATEQRLIYEFFQGGNDQMISWWLEHDDDVSVGDIADLTDKLASDIFERLKPQ